MLGRIQVVEYWKPYLRKNRYRCKRYFFLVPVRVGELLDRSVYYEVKLFGPFVVFVPKGMEFSLSILESSKNVNRQNTPQEPNSPTVSLS